MEKTIYDEREWKVKVIFKGDAYGLNDCLTHDNIEPTVEFWDLTHNQFVSRYYLTTLMEIRGHGLNLHGGVPGWQIDADSVRQVQNWLSQLDWWKHLPEGLPEENKEAWLNMPPDLRHRLCWENRP